MEKKVMSIETQNLTLGSRLAKQVTNIVKQSKKIACSCGTPPAIRLCEGIESCLKCGEKLSK
jgi:ribosomal protein L37AE/L43A